MADKRIIDLPLASEAETDDYMAIDGATNGTRRLNVSESLAGATTVKNAVCADEEGATVSQAYAIGKYFWSTITKGLKKVTAAISSGASVTSSNTDDTTVADELTAINSEIDTINSNLTALDVGTYTIGLTASSVDANGFIRVYHSFANKSKLYEVTLNSVFVGNSSTDVKSDFGKAVNTGFLQLYTTATSYSTKPLLINITVAE